MTASPRRVWSDQPSRGSRPREFALDRVRFGIVRSASPGREFNPELRETMNTARILIVLLLQVLLTSCKHLEQPSDTPAAARPESLGGIPYHR